MKIISIAITVMVCLIFSCESSKETSLLDPSFLGEWIVDADQTLLHLVRKDLQEAAKNNPELLKDRLSKVYLRVVSDGYYTSIDGEKYTLELISRNAGVWHYKHGIFPNLTMSFELLGNGNLKRTIISENGDPYEVRIFKRKIPSKN